MHFQMCARSRHQNFTLLLVCWGSQRKATKWDRKGKGRQTANTHTHNICWLIFLNSIQLHWLFTTINMACKTKYKCKHHTELQLRLRHFLKGWAMWLYCKDSYQRLTQKSCWKWHKVGLMLLILPFTHSNFGNPILTTKLLVHFYSVLQSMSFFICDRKKNTLFH
jgi:hypothetical protein